MVLVISGYDDFSYAVEMLRSGAFDYLLKPVEQERLFEALEKLEGQYQQRQAQREEPRRFAALWDFPSWPQYLDTLGQWLDGFCGRTTQEFADYENKQKIRQAAQYIQQHFREPLSMTVVSNHVSMNYSLFSLLFKQYTGVNFTGYLQELRLEEAKRLLEETDWRVNEICRRAGFSDDKHFLKVFKAAVGISPTEYRWAKAPARRDGD